MSGPDVNAQLVGAVLDGGYRIVRLIGAGGMGAVYEAVKLPLNNRVALKVMARELATSTESLKRFHREAQITSSLGHPHIVQVFDFGTVSTGEPFLVMEYLSGEDLHRRIRREGRLSLWDTVHIIKQVGSALSATHERQIVHRDLKPANIFVLDAAGERDFVKVLDFGISKARTSTTQLTRDDARMGTPDYMAPEQALGQVDAIDHRTDQWALACIAWEALSGSGPFLADDGIAMLFQVVNVDPAALVDKVPGLPSDVEQVLRRALSKRKQERFPTIAEFAAALETSAAKDPCWAAASAPSARTVSIAVASPPAPAQTRASTTLAASLGEAKTKPEVRSRWRWPALLVLVVAGGLSWLLPARGKRAAVQTEAIAPARPSEPPPVERPAPSAQPPAPPAVPAAPPPVPVASSPAVAPQPKPADLAAPVAEKRDASAADPTVEKRQKQRASRSASRLAPAPEPPSTPAPPSAPTQTRHLIRHL